MTTTAALTVTSTNGILTLTITDQNGETETHTVKDGNGCIRRIDRKLSDLMWNRSGFEGNGSATLTRPATYTLLTKLNG
jgi:hypothetical protein